MKLTIIITALALSACATPTPTETDSREWRECDSQVVLMMYLLKTDDAATEKDAMSECMRLKERK